MKNVVAMPTPQAVVASPVCLYTGPSTRNTMPMVEGVSSPRGMAVTSCRPRRRARRKARAVYNRSPTSTPSAVPGTMRVTTKSSGKPNAPDSNPASTTRFKRLSSTSPKKAFRSPQAAQR